eukprot:Nitzschia sp. Nitz4//scaffold96_size78090//30074//32267//NITZ4_005491-RA/size78090-augustus-gene-0.13-mRNA-1//-1//CDS//3329560564//1774//frame0
MLCRGSPWHNTTSTPTVRTTSSALPMSGTTTAEEARLKAMAIAARLSGNAGATSATTTSAGSDNLATSAVPKRKRWGVAPPSVLSEAANEVLPGLDAAKRAKTTTDVPVTVSKKIWVRTNEERGAAHFKAYFEDRLEKLQNRINESKTPSDTVQLQLKGRGSSNEPPPPGMPEEPMHILITAPSDAVIATAEPPVDELLIEAEQAPVEAVDPEDVKMAAAVRASAIKTDGSSLALTTTGSRAAAYSTSNSSYRPATVAQLIANNPIHANIGEGDLLEETVNVPNGIVGFLIGRGGETISSMQARSSCKVQIQKEHELAPGQTHRVITLQAATQESINQCREMIESMVEDRIRAAGGSVAAGAGAGGSKDAKVQEALLAGHALVTVLVPDADVGLIIGKAGSTIKAIQDQTGAQVQIPPSSSTDENGMRHVSITHPSEGGAHEAKRRIEDLLKSKPSFSNSNGGPDHAGPQITIQVMIPDQDVGLCIGRQGCVIREMQQKSGTRIQIPSQPTPGQPHRVATISGTQEGCNTAQGFIQRIINEQSSACVMSGTPQHNFAQGYQQQGASQNSAEWQAYYAAQAVAKQQGQHQQQVQGPAPAPAATQAAAAPAPAADAYYEQFFRYSYYYGEDAARQYYGAWSPPVGTPNPYGVNPNGITPAPATQASAQAPAPAPQPAPAPAPYAQQQPRDTSVRKVSNLPAWMTQGK